MYPYAYLCHPVLLGIFKPSALSSCTREYTHAITIVLMNPCTYACHHLHIKYPHLYACHYYGHHVSVCIHISSVSPLCIRVHIRTIAITNMYPWIYSRHHYRHVSLCIRAILIAIIHPCAYS
ncbi:hypothetical protein CDAR_504491 [Caerostris darwini]|uniref:Uncharacterized protein n=1 Tax=Caerostris darwini TaxID=1538125 RepID=A0AAV4PU46_9ARAC|nr:hypothetical protein CDAR_504491 [Caerostris darwini]